MSRISAQSLQALKSPFLSFVKGNPAAEALRPLPPSELSEEGHLVFVSTQEQLHLALEKKPAIVVAGDKVNLDSVSPGEHQAFFSTPFVQAAMTLILPFFEKERFASLQPGVHPLAFVDSSAKIGERAVISAHCFVGPDAHVGDDVILMPGAVIEGKAKVGAKSVIHSHVVIGFNCEVGKECLIHANTTIGSDGFGFVTEPKTKMTYKVPQIGNVVLGDRVEVGANCAIDRATLATTRIGSGTKLDNFVHIAHNSQIGKNCLLAGGFMTAGSAVLGDNVVAGGGVHIKDHVRIADNVSLGGRTGVLQDITEPGVYVGYPAEPLREGMKTLANLKHVASLRRQMATVIKHLGLDIEA